MHAVVVRPTIHPVPLQGSAAWTRLFYLARTQRSTREVFGESHEDQLHPTTTYKNWGGLRGPPRTCVTLAVFSTFIDVWCCLIFTVRIGATVHVVIISSRGGEDRNGAETRLAALAGGRVACGVRRRGILEGSHVNVQDVGVDLLPCRIRPAGAFCSSAVVSTSAMVHVLMR